MGLLLPNVAVVSPDVVAISVAIGELLVLLWREGFGEKCAIARLTLVNFENGREIYPQSARRKYRKQGALDL